MTEEKKDWFRMTLTTASREADIIDYLVSLLFEVGAQGTEVKYAPGYLENHPNLFGEIPEELPEDYLSHPTQVLGNFYEELDWEAVYTSIKAESGMDDLIFQVDQMQWENWQENWMKYYKVQDISRFLKIVPVWEDYQANDSMERLIFLDPGVAFGTGDHPTTQLGSQALELVMRGGERVLDVGTGSGVLSFVAAALGASQVWGYDLDPQAVDAAKMNLQYQGDFNKVREEGETLLPIEFAVNDLLKGVSHQADVIVANILPHILVEMFEDAYKLLVNEGYLILGGILEDKKDFVLEHLPESQWQLIQTNLYKGWVGLILRKRVVD